MALHGIAVADPAVAPVIANHGERAGRVKAAHAVSVSERSLDAPKRSRKIECRSDVKSVRLLRRDFDSVTEHNRADFRALFSGKLRRHQAQISATIRHAPQHIIDTGIGA